MIRERKKETNFAPTDRPFSLPILLSTLFLSLPDCEYNYLCNLLWHMRLGGVLYGYVRAYTL